MTSPRFAPLEIADLWARINEELIELLELVPDDKIDWSPAPGLWNFRGIALHICIGRHYLMQMIIKDGQQSPDLLQAVQTRDGMYEQLRLSWRRMVPFLSDPELLSREYEAPLQDRTVRARGHWLAFGHIEHDVHHRADIVHYLDALGIAHPEPDTLARRLAEA